MLLFKSERPSSFDNAPPPGSSGNVPPWGRRSEKMPMQMLAGRGGGRYEQA